jgi:hypothetical protein
VKNSNFLYFDLKDLYNPTKDGAFLYSGTKTTVNIENCIFIPGTIGVPAIPYYAIIFSNGFKSNFTIKESQF